MFQAEEFGTTIKIRRDQLKACMDELHTKVEGPIWVYQPNEPDTLIVMTRRTVSQPDGSLIFASNWTENE